jgi:hypothetical protein
VVLAGALGERRQDAGNRAGDGDQDAELNEGIDRGWCSTLSSYRWATRRCSSGRERLQKGQVTTNWPDSVPSPERTWTMLIPVRGAPWRSRLPAILRLI